VNEKTSPKMRARLLWVGVAIAVLLAMGGTAGGALWWFWPKRDRAELPGKRPAISVIQPRPKAQVPKPEQELSDLDFISPNAAIILSVRVADLWKNQAIQRYVRMTERYAPPGQDPLSLLNQQVGLHPSQIERQTMVVVEPNRGPVWIIVKTTAPYARDKLLAMLSEAREVPYNGKIYHRGKTQLGLSFAVYCVNDHVLVLGPETGVQRCLADLEIQHPGQTNDTLQTIQQGHDLVFLLPTSQPGMRREIEQTVPPQFRHYLGMLDFTRVKMLGNLDSVLDLQLTASYGEASQTQKVKQQVSELLSVGQLFVPPAAQEELTRMNKKEEAQEIANVLKSLLAGITVTQADKDVTVQARVDPKMIEKLLAAFLPRDLPSARFSQENYARISKGMTEAVVLGVLGSPNSTSTSSDPASGQERTLRWYLGPEEKIEVVLHNGRVVSKSGPFDPNPVLLCKGHHQPVTSVAFNPEGNRLVSTGLDQTVKTWNADQGTELHSLTGHLAPITCLAFRPDGLRFATGSEDGTVILWDAGQAMELLSLRTGQSAVTAVAFSPDGTRLASAGRDHTVKIWDADTGTESLVLKGHTAAVTSVAFSPYGERLASASADHTVKVWDIQQGTEVFSLGGFTSTVHSVVYSPEGTRLATGCADHTVKVWDAFTGNERLTLPKLPGAVVSVTFSLDGERLASGSLEGTVKIWEVHQGKEIFSLTRQTTGVASLAFSPDGNRLACAGEDGTIKVWEVVEPLPPLLVQRPPAGRPPQGIRTDRDSTHQALIGRPAWPLEVETWVHGEPLTPKQLKGKVVLLDFFAAWCPPCIRSCPHLTRLHDQYGNKGLKIVTVTRYYGIQWDEQTKRISRGTGVPQEAERTALRQIAQHHGMKHSLGMLPRTSALFRQYGVQAIPEFVLIDRRGNIRLIRVGNNTTNFQTIEEMINKLLAEPAP
jgi:WD40 repeat protein/thiol-disulfide isomerase/thioredoxin